METMLDNLINGNLKDARRMAKRFSLVKIVDYLLDTGWSQEKAWPCAAVLKGKLGDGSWEAWCARPDR